MVSYKDIKSDLILKNLITAVTHEFYHYIDRDYLNLFNNYKDTYEKWENKKIVSQQSFGLFAIFHIIRIEAIAELPTLYNRYGFLLML